MGDAVIYALVSLNVATVVGFLVFIDRLLKEWRDERTVLHNRVARPELIVTPRQVSQAEPKRAEDVLDDFERVGHIGDWGSDA